MMPTLCVLCSSVIKLSALEMLLALSVNTPLPQNSAWCATLLALTTRDPEHSGYTATLISANTARVTEQFHFVSLGSQGLCSHFDLCPIRLGYKTISLLCKTASTM